MARREQPLLDCLAELRHGVGEFRALLPGVNDPDLRLHSEQFIATALDVAAAHVPEPRTTVADDLAGLMTAVRLLSIPAHDPELGRTEALTRLRSGKGLVMAALADALDAARKIDLIPLSPPLPEEIASNISKAGIVDLLNGIARRLKQVEDGLRALATESEQQGPPQQQALVGYYVSSMRAEVSMVKLQLEVDDKRVDIGAVARAVDAMSTLAGEFVATVKGLGARIPQAVASLARKSARSVVRVTSGLRTIVTRVMTARRKDLDEPQPALVGPPEGFDIERVKAMVVRAVAPPSEWVPWITELDLSGSNIQELTALSSLTSLQTLVLDRTQSRDLSPLSALTTLQVLGLNYTQVVDLKPISTLGTLQMLELNGTPIVDLTPLSTMAALQTLLLDRTQVTDVTHLSRIATLQRLDLDSTEVADLAPLSTLTNLRTLFLNDTLVADLTPLSELTALRALHLNGTPVGDLAPLSSLTALQTLHLDSTQVIDLTPLSSLTELDELSLVGTQVTDLAPLSSLTALLLLDLDDARAADLTPLSALTALETLYLSGTKTTELAPLITLTALRTLHLRGTQVANFAPLSKLTALERLNLNDTGIIDLAPLSALTKLQTLNLRDTPVTDLSPLSALTKLESLQLDGTQITDLTAARHVRRIMPPEGGDYLNQEQRQNWRPQS